MSFQPEQTPRTVRSALDLIGTDEAVELNLVVTNTGDRAGDEVVQVYLHDPVARVARPGRDPGYVGPGSEMPRY